MFQPSCAVALLLNVFIHSLDIRAILETFPVQALVLIMKALIFLIRYYEVEDLL